ncbi:hypothetical protein [Nocardia seriolae]|nr:hypothetical protein [Nocardia seriolae]QOW33279.1 hypothetical protein IMZ23_36710 [Nocardia seriolae]WNJ60515.1 hypothetical protein RMO66_07055 [Nocardia seriolae]
MISIPTGELATILTALAMRRTGHPPILANFGITMGATAITALALLLTGVGGHETFGLWERIAAFPGLIWSIILGLTLLT